MISMRKIWNSIRRRLANDRGSAMLEFVLIAPLLCYLIAGILFFRHHIDYAMDSIMRARFQTWDAIPPEVGPFMASEDSDDSSFFLDLPVRTAVQVNVLSAVTGGFDSVGGTLLAVNQYLGPTPYERLDLEIDNYEVGYADPEDVPVEPWGAMLGGFGRFFGERFGGGTGETLRGLHDVQWVDRYPQIGDPWMTRTEEYSEDLDSYNYHIPFLEFLKIGYVFEAINVMALGRCPVPRYDTRSDVDVGRERWTPEVFGFDTFSLGGKPFGFFGAETEEDRWKLERVSSQSTIEDIIN